MRYTGIQPQYFPRLHYFARILNTDVFMIRDDVQFVRKHKYPNGKNDKSYQADTPIKQSTGLQFLSVPIAHNGVNSIKNTPISYAIEWQDTHLKTLEFVYSKSPYYEQIFLDLMHIIEMSPTTIAELNITTICWAILRLLGEQKITKEAMNLDFMNKKLGARHPFRLKEIKQASKSPALENHPEYGPN
ncbi:MAG: WbqC family protein, partial [Patescibacteria group bacterium]